MLSQPVDFLLYIFEIDIPVWSTNKLLLSYDPSLRRIFLLGAQVKDVGY